MKVALIGNPNVGKTALINSLTGGNFTVGNFPGVTVEKKEGKAIIDGKEIKFVDLPGIYSLQAKSLDEKVTRDFLVNERPDLIINVVNSSNLERNLYLTLELTDFQIPMIVVLNMIDIAEGKGIRINSEKLSDILSVPIVKCVANRGIGIEELKREILKGGNIPKKIGKSFDEKVKIAEKIAKEVVEYRARIIIGEMLDDVFMDKILGLPIFFSLMWMMFTFTYDVARPLIDIIDILFSKLIDIISSNNGLIFEILASVVRGVCSVLVFLPNIAFLFIALSFLELSGYMPRAVYLLDSIMSKFKLQGRSVISIIMGFGCNVPAVLATRSIEDDRVRKATVLAIPFMSCSARLPIYVLFTSVFFPRNGNIVIMFLYLLGVLIGLISALILRKVIFKGESEYILELPPYMLPNPKEIILLTWSRVKHFLEKAGTIIVVMAVIIWLITSYPTGYIESSYAGLIGRNLQPLFQPMGWDYKLVIALITGFVAKEVVVETINLVNFDITSLNSVQAFSYIAFTSLYIPCFATIAAIRGEIGLKWAIFSVIQTFVVAYLISLIITGVGYWLV